MKPPEAVAAQRIPAFLPAISALADAHGRALCFSHYVLFSPLADAHGAADLLGYDDPPKVVNSSDDTGCFHISFSFV